MRTASVTLHLTAGNVPPLKRIMNLGTECCATHFCLKADGSTIELRFDKKKNAETFCTFYNKQTKLDAKAARKQ